jgi:hypothetical protein
MRTFRTVAHRLTPVIVVTVIAVEVEVVVRVAVTSAGVAVVVAAAVATAVMSSSGRSILGSIGTFVHSDSVKNI